MIKRKITRSSKWKKGDKLCTMYSVRENDADMKMKFWFAGWNPFPCFHMMSTYEVIEKWMKENGWEMLQTGSIASFEKKEIDDETGEIKKVDTTVHHYNSLVKVPVPKVEYIRTTEIEKSIPELLKEGKKISAAKLYYKAMGVSLKEAVAAIDTMKAQMDL